MIFDKVQSLKAAGERSEQILEELRRDPGIEKLALIVSDILIFLQ